MNGKTKNVIASLCAVAALAFAGIGGYMVGQSPAQPRDISASDRVDWETITGSDNSSVAVFNNIAGTTPDLFGAVKVSTVGAQTAAGTYTGKIYFNIQILNY